MNTIFVITVLKDDQADGAHRAWGWFPTWEEAHTAVMIEKPEELQQICNFGLG